MRITVFFSPCKNCSLSLYADAAEVGPVFSVVVVEYNGDLWVALYVLQFRGIWVRGNVDVFAVGHGPDRTDERLGVLAGGCQSANRQFLNNDMSSFERLLDKPFTLPYPVHT